jgi:WD40 repeat protein
VSLFFKQETDVVRLISSARNDPQTCLCASSDGEWIGTGTAEGSVSVFSAQSGRRVMTTKPHSFFVSGVCFSPDAKHVLSVSGDCSLRIRPVVQEKRGLTFWIILLSILVLVLAIFLRIK